VSENENYLSIRIYYYLSYIIDETHIKPGGIMVSSDICNIKIDQGTQYADTRPRTCI